MSIHTKTLVALIFGCASQAHAQEQHTLPTELAAPGAPAFIPKTTKPAFGEGVVADWEGNVYFNELNVSPKRTLRLAVGADTSKEWREAGDNGSGMWLDSQNRILICQARAIVRVKPGPIFDHQTDTLSKNPSGDNFNDITGDSKDNLYFTNFRGGSVFFRDAETGKTTEALGKRPRPNGLEWDEERKRLYVNENGAGEVVVYNVNDDYSLTFRKKFADIHRPDGTALDEHGNLYAVGFDQGVFVFDPEGQLLGKIPLAGSQLTNVGFGGADFRTLFMITNRGLYKLPMRVKGYKTGQYALAVRPARIAYPARKRKPSVLIRDGSFVVIVPGPGTRGVDINGRLTPHSGTFPPAGSAGIPSVSGRFAIFRR